MGPVAGTAWNITMMSYAGTLFMGVHVDPAAVEDTDLLMRSLRDGFAELLAARQAAVATAARSMPERRRKKKPSKDEGHVMSDAPRQSRSVAFFDLDHGILKTSPSALLQNGNSAGDDRSTASPTSAARCSAPWCCGRRLAAIAGVDVKDLRAREPGRRGRPRAAAARPVADRRAQAARRRLVGDDAHPDPGGAGRSRRRSASTT